MMTPEGLVDGSWCLTVHVPDMLVTDHVIRVKSDSHIGGVTLQLVERLGNKRTCRCSTCMSLITTYCQTIS